MALGHRIFRLSIPTGRHKNTLVVKNGSIGGTAFQTKVGRGGGRNSMHGFKVVLEPVWVNRPCGPSLLVQGMLGGYIVASQDFCHPSRDVDVGVEADVDGWLRS